jgi:uncharacterized membrane-anchored protein YhcB (DUF1043 family)
MEGELEQIPVAPIIAFEISENGVKMATMDVVLSSGEKITLKFGSRFQGKKQLLDKALSAKDYEKLYHAITSISEKDLPELTQEEIEELTEHNPEGYTLEDYRKLNPDSALKIKDNPIGVEYTLTFGTGMGKYLTHQGDDYDALQNHLSVLNQKGNGESEEAENIRKEMRKIIHMRTDYQRLSNYAHPSVFKDHPESHARIIAEIRSFRKLHPWVYKEIIADHERNKDGKKKFVIEK